MRTSDTQDLVYTPGVQTRAVRACWAVGASGLFSALSVVIILVERPWRPAPYGADVLGFSGAAMVLKTLDWLVVHGAGVVWLFWLYGAFRAARAMGARVTESPSLTVLAYCIPVVNLVWPVLQMRELHRALAPEALPDAPVVPASDALGGYRDQAAAAPEALPTAAPIGRWWGLWVASALAPSLLEVFGVGAAFARGPAFGLFALSTALGMLLRVGGAVFAVSVVCTVTARLAFYERRMDALTAQRFGA